MALINLSKKKGAAESPAAPAPVVKPKPAAGPTSPSAKQPPSIYTVMLLLAMLFMLIACVAMYVERARWGPDFHNTNAARPQVMVVSAGGFLLS